MMNLLQRGRLEVETDLLLGAEEVLLAAGAVPVGNASWQTDAAASAARGAHADPAASETPPIAPRSGAARGFDAALFATGAGAVSSPPSERAPLARPPTASNAAPVDTRLSIGGSNTDEPPRRTFAPQGGLPGDVAHAPAPIVPLVDRVAPPAGADNAERLLGLQQLHARGCGHCSTSTSHTNLVFGDGNPQAELVFVGEAPGESEDRLGRPFVGRAGEKLDEMIAAMGLRRDEVYVANVLKSRPPDNRTPLAHEIDACAPYLLAQLAIIRPKVIVTLGGPASKLLLASELGITRLRGVAATVRLGVAEGRPFDVPVMPTFHPAYLLRNYTVETRQQVWEDLKKVLGLLGRPVPTKAASRG